MILCPSILGFNSIFKIRSIRVRIYEDLIHCDHGAPVCCLCCFAHTHRTAQRSQLQSSYVYQHLIDRLERHVDTRTNDAEAKG